MGYSFNRFSSLILALNVHGLYDACENGAFYGGDHAIVVAWHTYFQQAHVCVIFSSLIIS